MNFKAWVLIGIACVSFGAVGMTKPLKLTTENYPPFNMSARGKNAESELKHITGISTDIVVELFKRAEMEFTIGLYPWKKAYRWALEKPNHGVFSTTRTEAREPLFQWVEPLVENKTIMSLALHKSTPMATVDQLNSLLQQM